MNRNVELPAALVNANRLKFQKMADFLYKECLATVSGRDLSALSRQYRAAIADVLSSTPNANARRYATYIRELRKLEEHIAATLKTVESGRDVASLVRQQSLIIKDIALLTANKPLPIKESALEAALRGVRELTGGDDDSDD